MFLKFIDWLAVILFSAHHKSRRNSFLISFLFLFPSLSILFIATVSSQQIAHALTKLAFERRQAMAGLAATTIKERLDRITDIGLSLASRVRFRQLIEEGKWEEAMAVLKDVPSTFSFIDRLFLTDPAGTEMVDYPPVIDALGEDFSAQDWYQKIIGQWKPSVSEVYKRSTVPRYNVIAVATPIRNVDEKVLGILVMQIPTDVLFSWTKDFPIGRDGFIFLVDAKGRLAAHPKFSPQGEIVDFSGAPAIKSGLAGRKGTVQAFDPIEGEERIAAYEPILPYGWVIVAEEPVRTAFSAQNRILDIMVGVYIAVFLLNGLLLSFIHTIFEVLRKHRQGLQDSEWRLATQYAVAQILAEGKAIDEIAPRVIQVICENSGWYLGAIWHVDLRAGVLRRSKSWHIKDKDFTAFEDISGKTDFKPGIGLPGRVWSSGKPAWIGDLSKDANFPRAPYAQQCGLHAGLGFPIFVNGRVIGIFEFFSKEILEPDRQLLAMLEGIGHQIGRFIEHKNAEEELKASNLKLAEAFKNRIPGN